MTDFIAQHHDELSRVLQDQWGLEAVLSRLPGENINILVDVPSADRAVLKIVDPAQANLYLERDVLGVLQHSGIPVPPVIPTFNDLPFIELEISGISMLARLQKFLPGQAWAESKSTSSLLHSIGACIAQTHEALAEFDDANGDADHNNVWNLNEALQHRNSISYVEDSDMRASLERCFYIFSQLAKPLLDACPQGMLHGDVNDENVLVDMDEVVGLLDVGDAGGGALIEDIAICLAYALQQSGVDLEQARALIEGYESVRMLTDIEYQVVFPLILARLATSACIGAARKKSQPDHVTWFSHESATFEAIHRLIGVSPFEAMAVLSGKKRKKCTSAIQLQNRRTSFLAPSLSLSYEEPLHIVRGEGAHLFSDRGFPYLDLVNNVCHVGHTHPHVVREISRQASALNTNTRYLHSHIVDYADRLQKTLPTALDTCFFVNSGSEANELALRLARAATGSQDILVIDGAYHGNTSNCVAMSPYKFNGPGGEGAPDWVHVVPVPDQYRGVVRGEVADVGKAYADTVHSVIHDLHRKGRKLAGFFAEPILSCGGQIPLPEGYLAEAFQHVRNAGGVCIADEVQVGFGRVGDSFWGFELHQVVPDIVVMGKPIGNGHPMGAVVTTRAIAEAFNNGIEFFSTFGGSNLSCLIANEVLQIVDDERLRENAKEMGVFLEDGLLELKHSSRFIGDIRGMGLFWGVEIVRNLGTKEPGAFEADYICNRLREERILIGLEGPNENVLKLRPPLCIVEDDIGIFLKKMKIILRELSLMDDMELSI